MVCVWCVQSQWFKTYTHIHHINCVESAMKLMVHIHRCLYSSDILWLCVLKCVEVANNDSKWFRSYSHMCDVCGDVMCDCVFVMLSACSDQQNTIKRRTTQHTTKEHTFIHHCSNSHSMIDWVIATTQWHEVIPTDIHWLQHKLGHEINWEVIPKWNKFDSQKDLMRIELKVAERRDSMIIRNNWSNKLKIKK